VQVRRANFHVPIVLKSGNLNFLEPSVPLHLDETCLLYIRTQSVPRSKHTSPRLYKTNLLISCKVKAAVCSEIYTKHLNGM
jgi:hypothetical protein